MGLLSKVLLGYRTITQNFATFAAQNVLEVQGAATVTNDAANNRTILFVGGSTSTGTFGEVVAGELALGGQTPPQVQITPQPTTTTTDASTATLGTFPIPAGSGGRLRCVITAKLVGANANSWLCSVFEGIAGFLYPTGGSLVTGGSAPVAASSILRTPLFGVSGGAQLAISASGSSLVVTGTGPNAATAYSHSLAVVAINAASGICVVSNGGNLYLVTTGGTTAASGAGPTGTGSSIAEGSGSAVVYAYLGPAAAGIVIQWTLAIAELVSG